MGDHVVEVADGFWNIRGSFRIFGVVDIGTQASLVRRPGGGFLLLDSYTLEGPVAEKVLELTDGGEAVEAVLNLHPFHTIHVKGTHARFPNARHYGLGRHAEKAPDHSWEPVHTDDPAIQEQFPELVFSVPQGVDLVGADPNVHFGSVLAFHPASRTLHVDDTLMHTSIPFLSGVRFHPTLKHALQKRPGAAADFRAWTDSLRDQCAGVQNLCAAHTKPLLGTPIAERVEQAIAAVQPLLDAHAKEHG